MAVLVEATSTLGRRLKVSVPDQNVAAQIKEKMAKLSKNAHIKGFRPGKIPPQVLQQKFGESVRSEVINEIITQSLTDAVKENQLQPAGTPRIEELKAKQGEDLEFIATFEIYPEITLGDFTEIEIEKRTVDITPNDVEKMITKLKDQLASWVEVDRKTQMGDRLKVDFARKIKDENTHREEEKNIQMTIGDKGVLPGLSEAVSGKQKGEEIETNLRYPNDWADENVAGKEVTLWITIHAISEKNLLTLEELAEKLGIEDKSTQTLNQKVQDRMQDELTRVLQDELKEKTLEKLLEKNPIELPLALIEQEKEAIYREMVRSRRGQNVSKNVLSNPEVSESAKRRVELGLLLNEVIKKDDIKADGQRVRAEIEKIASKFAQPKEIVDAYYGSNELLSSVERLVLLEQAVDAILKGAKVTSITSSFFEVMESSDEN